MINYGFAQPKDLSGEDVARINVLLKQLAPDSEPVSAAHLMSSCDHSHVLLARDSEQSNVIIGMATLIPVWKPIRLEGRIEDVVVDEVCRGRGYGRELSQRLIDKARTEGMSVVELTSSPHRVPANRLYQSLGFERKETNVYVFKL